MTVSHKQIAEIIPAWILSDNNFAAPPINQRLVFVLAVTSDTLTK